MADSIIIRTWYKGKEVYLDIKGYHTVMRYIVSFEYKIFMIREEDDVGMLRTSKELYMKRDFLF